MKARVLIFSTFLLSSIAVQGESMPSDSLYTYRWEEGSWSYHSKEIYGLTATGEPADTTRSVYLLNTWLPDWRSTLSYDFEGKRAELIRQLGNEQGWENNWRWTYTYDEMAQLTMRSYSLYEGGAWDLKLRLLLSYDGSGNLAQEVRQLEGGSSWYNDVRRVLAYNEADQTTEIVHQLWDWDGEIWKDVKRELLDYNHSGNRTQWLLQAWENQGWVNERQLIWDYDSMGSLLTRTEQYALQDQWLDVQRLIYSVDGGGKFLSIVTQDWDYDETAWYDVYQEIIDYDLEGRRTQIISQAKDDQNQVWVNHLRSRWFYTSPNSIDAIQPRDYVLYQNIPNPFNPSTLIRFRLASSTHINVTIYNIQGQAVLTLMDKNMDAGEHELSWTGVSQTGELLATGVYICRLSSQHYNQSIKMVFVR
jgi:hypothetical protein